jgi:glycosyltransferase involved in cell wall biosynthesis
MEQIQQLGISDRIVLCTDFIPDSQVNLYFRACDIVAQPYKSATQSGVTQIAFHFEKPMLVTNVGGLAEIVPDGKIGYVVNPDAQDIADALVRYYKENKEEEFTAGVREEKLKYGWDRMTAAVLNSYSQIK